jgi:hypothetical protein
LSGDGRAGIHDFLAKIVRERSCVKMHSWEETLYFPDSGLGAGFAAGRGFFAGLEMPKLMRRKPNPLRSESSTLIFPFLSNRWPYAAAQKESKTRPNLFHLPWGCVQCG